MMGGALAAAPPPQPWSVRPDCEFEVGWSGSAGLAAAGPASEG